jgi:flavin-dependent dehydrogenase
VLQVEDRKVVKFIRNWNLCFPPIFVKPVTPVEQYDVIIVGGGPAGLQCAGILSRSDLRVLLLEKNEQFGDKLCAGGLTIRDLELLPLPDHVIQQSVSHAVIRSRRRSASTITPVPYLFTVDRKELGAYQRGLLDGTSVTVMTRSQVTEIDSDRITLRNGQTYGYRTLVGADGYASLVRRHLGLSVRRRLIGFQYTIPLAAVDPVVEIYLEARRFHVWYAWIFPHRDTVAVGCCCDPDVVDHIRVKEQFHDWLREKGIGTGDAKLESHPIGYDYRGVRFGNIFLAGEAAGLTSGLTGEGIYQSLASGQEVAHMIMDPDYSPELLGRVLKYNRMLERIKRSFLLAGPFRGFMQELFVCSLNLKPVRMRVKDTFS